MDSERWDAVRSAIAGHLAASGLTQGAYAKDVGVDPGTLGDFLDGRRTANAPSQAKYERALGWKHGTIADIVAGRVEVPTGNAERPESDASELEVALGLDLSDMEPTERTEVLAAAMLAALERRRQLAAERMRDQRTSG